MTTARHWLVMAVMSFSGGAIFLLPFLQEVYYIPLAEALDLNNTQVGGLLSIFGTFSLLSYFPGGWLADRLSPRKLMTISLVATGVAGFYFATFPSYEISLAIHALWGVCISLLFWGAMIRTTRNWAPPEEQGRAFGILETGRGLGEVLPSMGFLAVFAALGSTSLALSQVVILFSVLFIALGVLSWLIMEEDVNQEIGDKHKVGLDEIIAVLKMPIVWLITIVILTAYCGYWGLFRFTPYATEVFALSVTVGAVISVGKMWLKPIAALAAGFVGDHFGIARSMIWLFVLLIGSYGLAAVIPGTPTFVPVMLLALTIASVAVFAMRGIYFALLEEGGVPATVTGTATGVVSAIAFTPDIFMPLIGGVLIDQYPGPEGYRYFFSATAGICVVGLMASLVIYFRIVKPSTRQPDRQAPQSPA
jgi:MFS transporter, GlpU family, inner membrane protein